MKNYYAILGVSRTDPPSRIRSAFRDLARRHHPDLAGPGSTSSFRDILEAYETLSDPAARRQHDQQLAAVGSPAVIAVRRAERPAREPLSLFRSGGDVRPSFELLLDRVFRNFTQLGVPKSEHAEPLVCDVQLTAEEARQGGVLPIRVPVLVPCAWCHGAGRSAFFPCLACDARGWEPRETVVELRMPAGVRSGSAFDFSLAELGIENLWLHVRVRIGS